MDSKDERKDAVTFKGGRVTLLGEELEVGVKAPDFKVLDGKLSEVGLSSYSGRVKLISVTPSLDTPVCDAQARRFNEEAASLPGDVSVINISMDLPFASNRFCSTAGIENVITLSDHRDASFGSAYGVLIKELRLLARAVFVIDTGDVVRYAEVVGEVTDEVDYEGAIKAVKESIG